MQLSKLICAAALAAGAVGVRTIAAGALPVIDFAANEAGASHCFLALTAGKSWSKWPQQLCLVEKLIVEPHGNGCKSPH